MDANGALGTQLHHLHSLQQLTSSGAPAMLPTQTGAPALSSLAMPDAHHQPNEDGPVVAQPSSVEDIASEMRAHAKHTTALAEQNRARVEEAISR